MLASLQLKHVGHAFLVGVVAGILFVALDNYVVVRAENAIGIAAGT